MTTALALFVQMAALPLGAVQWDKSDAGETAIVQMKSAPYPHESRADGFKVNNKVYPRDPHYIDNSVGIFIPKGYKPGDKTNLLVYFHGHMNNIRKAFDKSRLREQVAASGKNVIMVFPEGPKDAGDSGCGRLEEKDGLKNLVNETIDLLVAEGKVRSKEVGRVVLSGHSGAYLALSFCVERGGLPENVTDVALLDASYGRLDAFVDWVSKNPKCRFFSIFTEHLGGDNVYLMIHLKRRGVAYDLDCEQDATPEQVARNRVQFLYAEKLKHDETVQWLERWLKATTLPAR